MREQDKPEGAKLGWHILETTYPFTTPWIRLRQDHIAIAGKGEITYTYCQMQGSVAIVPVTPAGDIMLIRQYRYTCDSWFLEIPSGGLNALEGTLSMEELARKELREEIGATCQTMSFVRTFCPSNGITNEVCHVFLARDIDRAEVPHHEPAEFIEIVPTPASAVMRMVRDGTIDDGYSAMALFLCEPLLRHYGYLQPSC